MNLRQVVQFLAVADTLNFRKAADRLHMAQPPLSVSIRRLEEELGAQLFDRTQKGLRLTPVGRSVLADAERIAFHADQLKKTAIAATKGIAGTLRIGFVGSATYRLFPVALPAFREQYPQVTLDLRESTTSQILQDVERGALDLGLVRYPVNERTLATLKPVEHDRLIAAVPASSALAGKPDLALSDLASEPFILYSSVSASNLRGQVISACHAAGFTPRVAQEAVQVQTVLSLVESGIGVALVPSISQAHCARSIAFRLLNDEGDRLDVALAAAVHPYSEPAVAERFRQLLTELNLIGTRGSPAITP